MLHFKEGSVFVKVFVVKIVADTPCCGGKAKIGANMLRQKVTDKAKSKFAPPPHPPVGMPLGNGENTVGQ